VVHHNVKLGDIPKEALTIEVNGIYFNIDNVERVSKYVNVYDISFSRNIIIKPKNKIRSSGILATFGLNIETISRDNVIPSNIIKANNGDSVTLNFYSDKICEAISNRRLIDVLDGMAHPYLERDGRILCAHLIVDLPSLSKLSDVNLGTPSDGDVLVNRNGIWTSGKLEPGSMAGAILVEHTRILLWSNCKGIA